MSIESTLSSNCLILCLPFSFCIQPFSASVFSSELALHIRWSSIGTSASAPSPSNEYSGLISFRVDWLDLLAVQRTLKNLLQHHNLKASILQCSVFFMVQLSRVTLKRRAGSQLLCQQNTKHAIILNPYSKFAVLTLHISQAHLDQVRNLVIVPVLKVVLLKSTMVSKTCLAR